MVSRYSTFQIALEHRLTDKISLQYDFGPVIRVVDFDRTESDKRGFKAKIQLRRYYPQTIGHWRFFIAPEVSYNKVNFNRGETYLVQQGNDLDYYQYFMFKRKYREVAVGMNLGALFTAYRFCIDFQLGFAGRFIQYNNVDLSNEPTYTKMKNKTEGNSIFAPVLTTRNMLAPTGCIRFGFVLK